jgi:SH3-like domain-containing protein
MRAAFTILVLVPLAAYGQFRSIGDAPAVMYDAPSMRATKLYVGGRNLPVEVIASDGTWVKVRDPFGGLSWVEKKALVDRRTVLVAAPMADVRQRPDDNAPLAFQVQQGVVLDLVEVGTTGWAHVRHADGAMGYVRVGQVWGI